MGQNIIEALTSAFGIIPEMGKNIVAAFQVLFMNATTTGTGASAVTTYSGINGFGTFLLVMTGLAIGAGALSGVMRLINRKA